MNNPYKGSHFDGFLAEHGILAETEAAAVKRVIAFQIGQEMERQRLTKCALAKLMQTSRSSLDRLLDPQNTSVTLLTLENIATALAAR